MLWWVLTLRSSVHNHLWCEAQENKLEQAQREPETSPVMPVFHNLQGIPVEINVSIKIHVVESFHWDLVLSTIFDLIGLILEGKVVFDWAAWKLGFLIFARTER